MKMTFRYLLVIGSLMTFLCTTASTVHADCGTYPKVLNSSSQVTLWKGDFAQGLSPWGEIAYQFGAENLQIVSDPEGRFPALLRAHYKIGSYDPGTAMKGGAPLGGAQFTSKFQDINLAPSDRFVLTFSMRPKDGFNFVRGGKLPGFYGGTPRSGGKIPNGHDGFSTRIVWQTQGKGALYAYLPTSVTFGTVMGSGSWLFKPGRWVNVSQAVKLNTPGLSDGEVAVWIDGVLTHRECNLTFRDTETLKIDGIFFSTFFGGNDPSWASTSDTFIDFGDFKVSKLTLGW